jgi:hypothetical protein
MLFAPAFAPHALISFLTFPPVPAHRTIPVGVELSRRHQVTKRVEQADAHQTQLLGHCNMGDFEGALKRKQPYSEPLFRLDLSRLHQMTPPPTPTNLCPHAEPLSLMPVEQQLQSEAHHSRALCPLQERLEGQGRVPSLAPAAAAAKLHRG